MYAILAVLCSLNCFVSFAFSYNILAIFPHPSRSHHAVTDAVILALANRGHQVTMYSQLPIGPSSLPLANFVYKDISSCPLRRQRSDAQSSFIDRKFFAWKNPFLSVLDFVRGASLNRTAMEECTPLMEL